MRQAHPETSLIHEARERCGIGEPTLADALDAEVLRDPCRGERARAVHLAHAASPDAPEERVAPDAKLRLGGRHVVAACLALAVSAAWTCEAQPAVLVLRAAPEDEALAATLAARLVDGALDDGHDYALAPPPAAAALDAGWLTRATADADDRFARFDLAGASEVIARALARLDRDGPRGTEHRELVELALLEARVAEAEGNAVAAAAAAHRALVLSPDLVVDEARHPPTLTALIEAQRSTITWCALELLVAPSDAQIRVDGIDGAPPRLPCGTHWIAIDAPGYHGVSTHLEVSPSDTAPTEIALAVDPGAALLLASPPATPLARAAALLLDRELVFLELSRDGDALVVRLGERSARAPGDAQPDAILALLRAADHAGGFDVGIAAGVGVGAGVVLAAVITTLAIVLTPAAPTSFELRGQILP